MKIIAFIEARQGDVRKILEHRSLWHDSPSRAPPRPTCPPQPGSDPDLRLTCEVDPDFLEHARREELRADQVDLPREP